MLESQEEVGCLARRERVGEWAGGSGGVRRGVGGGGRGRWQGGAGGSGGVRRGVGRGGRGRWQGGAGGSGGVRKGGEGGGCGRGVGGCWQRGEWVAVAEREEKLIDEKRKLDEKCI